MGTLLFAVVGLLGLCRADSDLKCDNTTNHEVLVCRVPCPPQRTCQNFRGPEPPCAPPRGPCTNQCVCANGYARNKWGGTCVTLAQCDQCPGNNQYFSCDGAYLETCTGSCHCADGYERDANNVCVSTAPPPVVTHPSPPPTPIRLPSQPVQGPQPVPTKPQNSDLKCDNATNHEILACRFGCPPQKTCQNFRGPIPPCAPPRGPCTNQCVCANGYARNKWGGTCVTLAQCDQCPGNNQYFSCDGPYSETCTGSCHCADGYERDANNVCVSTKPPPVITHPSPPPTPILPSQPVQGPQPVPSKPQNTNLKCDNTTNHEVLECRDGCPPQRTCQNFRGPEPPCAPPMGPCTNQCVCADGYARNKWGGTCVTLAQCDQCPGNNQYFSCDGPYSETCTGSCHCADGYERDANNVCVSTTPPPVVTHPSPPPPPILPSEPVTSGPRSEILCNTLGHEIAACVFEYCPPERTCENIKLPVPVCGPTFLPCKPKCVCAEGYARNKEGKCVTFEQCVLTCNATKHEISVCTYGCPPEKTCQNRDWPPIPCARPPFPCTPKCVCDRGYARNQGGGTCVTLEQCAKCGENEIFQCDGEYSESCVGVCNCLSGYTRDINNKCIYVDPAAPPKDCPPDPEPEPQVLTCNTTKHEISVCTHGCPPEKTCQNRDWPPFPCAPPAFPCTPKCVCDDGYARNQDGGTCVTLAQCDKCGENEYFQCDGDYCENCVGHCYCFSGYTRDVNDKCVYVDPAAPPRDNGPPTPGPDKCPGNNQYFACDGPYSENCTGSCHCANGYERDANNICVSTTRTLKPRVYCRPPPLERLYPIHPVPPVRPVPPVKPVDPFEPDYYEDLPEIAIFFNL